jgi:hypothetical protein
MNDKTKDDLKKEAQRLLREAGAAWYAYAGECDLGDERTWAFEVYENLHRATRDTETRPS